MRSVTFFLVILFLGLGVAGATEACPEFPCRDSSGAFQRSRCTEQADWVAVGTITGVQHRIDGHPLNKDFTRFDFHIVRWEKGQLPNVATLAFEVGWCFNDLELPEDSSGEFRFYGSKFLGAGQETGPTYLYFEKLTKQSTGLLPPVATRH